VFKALKGVERAAIEVTVLIFLSMYITLEEIVWQKISADYTFGEQASKMTRFWWKAAGILAVALGVVGIVLPILPTTPFLLLAAYCFDRGSPALHNWLINHAALGPIIKAWRDYGAVPLSAKIAAVVFMSAALAGGFYVGLQTWILILQGVIFSTVAVFLITRPLPPEK